MLVSAAEFVLMGLCVPKFEVVRLHGDFVSQFDVKFVKYEESARAGWRLG